MTRATIRAVVVDDEPLARRRLRTLLAAHADVELVAECGDGPDAVAVVARERPDLVFLDVQMAELDGLDVARAIAGRSARPATEGGLPAIVFVTAFEQYAVDAFGVRALDYLLKPFDEERFVETLARARAHVATARRSAVHDRLLAIVHELDDPGEPRRRREVLRVADIEIDVAARAVHRGGESLFLRPKELELLVALARRPGEVVSRRELLAEVWGYKADVVSRTVDTHLAELRRKLGHVPSAPGYIQTVARMGYRIQP